MPCFAHIINIIGERLDLPLANAFLRHLTSIFSYSHASHQEWRTIAGVSFPSHSQTRWYSLLQVGVFVAANFHYVIRFLEESQYGMYQSIFYIYTCCMCERCVGVRYSGNTVLCWYFVCEHGESFVVLKTELSFHFIYITADKAVAKALNDLAGPTTLTQVLVQLSIMVDVGERLQWTCYKIEGDGPLGLYVYEIWLLVMAYLEYVIYIYIYTICFW